MRNRKTEEFIRTEVRFVPNLHQKVKAIADANRMPIQSVIVNVMENFVEGSDQQIAKALFHKPVKAATDESRS